MGSSLALDSVGRQTRGSSTRPWKQHKWSGEFAVNPLVGTEISSAKIEERVPVDKPASRGFPPRRSSGFELFESVVKLPGVRILLLPSCISFLAGNLIPDIKNI
jgi:hypothetical protein